MLRIARLLAWSLVVALVFVTLAPIGLRPVVVQSADAERALAYGLLGFLMALAYPRHRLVAFGFGVAVAAGLEVGQMLTADRHGRLPDFLVKAAASGFGVLTASILTLVTARRARPRACTNR